MLGGVGEKDSPVPDDDLNKNIDMQRPLYAGRYDIGCHHAEDLARWMAQGQC